MKKKKAMKKPEPPFCVQVEMTEGCNLYCDFCGLTGIREKGRPNFKFMTPKVAAVIARGLSDLDWHARIEFAQHGEPTMNPNAAEIVSIFRKHLPRNQLMMTSNGGGLLGDSGSKIEKLFDAGLNVLAIDEYQYVEIGPKIRKSLSTYKTGSGFDIHEYPQDITASPHKRWPRGTRVLIFVEDISAANKGNHSTLSNHCGAAAPLNMSAMGKACAKPFREMSVHWDGHVKACCQDWFGVLIPGKISSPSDVQLIWEGEIFSAMRRKLLRGERDFVPCLGCNYRTYRNGLLPDQRGKMTLPRPTQQDTDLLNSKVRKTPLNKPVSKVAVETLKQWRKK